MYQLQDFYIVFHIKKQIFTHFHSKKAKTLNTFADLASKSKKDKKWQIQSQTH